MKPLSEAEPSSQASTDPPAVDASLAPEKLIFPSLLRFTDTDPFQALEYFAELSGRTVLVFRNLRGENITLEIKPN